ncbi:hypothetical protein Lal_00040314 [Lupinus albus]|uniref:Putative transcription factor ZF-HD family n=1 Tax=Lupinus albus TaxID=3870 RepID=A0A6A5MZT1_LUPAL|nr:putative transcription factor ZF-HD family [Lupinus albus]KAF1877598.1 hypothetical protein Lal_00040314 [Lupinus albus]
MKRVEIIREDPKAGLTDSIVRVKNVTYGLCLKNHSIHPLAYTIDGCQMFTPSGEEGIDASRTCVACGCHRDHHRREETESKVKSENSSSSTNRS